MPDLVGQSLTTPSTNTIPEYTGDAASRVFAIPELLEHVLFSGVTSQYNQAVAEKNIKSLKMWPMPGCGSKNGICLFTIQRVSKDFQNTIQGSPKLKKLIFLAPQDHEELLGEHEWEKNTKPYYGDRPWLPLHKPLVSILMMFASMGKRVKLLKFGSQSMTTINSLSVHLEPMIVHEEKPLSEIANKKVPKGWHHPEASWRKIKMSNAKTRSAVKLQIETDFWCCNEMDAVPFDITLELGEDLTLEHVFDCVSELFSIAEDQLKKKEDFCELEDVDDWDDECEDKWNKLGEDSNKEILARLQAIVKR